MVGKRTPSTEIDDVDKMDHMVTWPRDSYDTQQMTYNLNIFGSKIERRDWLTALKGVDQSHTEWLKKKTQRDVKMGLVRR